MVTDGRRIDDRVKNREERFLNPGMDRKVQSRIVSCATSSGRSLGSQWQHPWYGAERNLLRLWLNSVRTAQFVIPSKSASVGSGS